MSSLQNNSTPDEKHNKKTILEKTSRDISVPEDSEILHYLLKLENGVVNIYEIYDNETKIKSGTLNISPQTLRKTDRINFENGIIIENANDILHLAEDFSS